MFEQLEKAIIGKILAIKHGKLTPKESNCAFLLNKMAEIDEPAYDTLMKRYKQAVNQWKEKNGTATA